MMAGRNISCSHVAFTSTRVMLTSATVGHAAGTAAAIAVKNSKLPNEVRKSPKLLKEVQQLI